MSAVRMCDKCGAIFPEGIEGSAIMNGSQTIRDERTGRLRTEDTTMDVCPDCSGSRKPTPRISAALEAAPERTVEGWSPDPSAVMDSTFRGPHVD